MVAVQTLDSCYATFYTRLSKLVDQREGSAHDSSVKLTWHPKNFDRYLQWFCLMARQLIPESKRHYSQSLCHYQPGISKHETSELIRRLQNLHVN